MKNPILWLLLICIVGPVRSISAQDIACQEAASLEDAIRTAKAGVAGVTIPVEQENAAVATLNLADSLFSQIEEIGMDASTADDFDLMARLLRRSIDHFEDAFLLSPCSATVIETLLDQGYIPLRSLAYDAGSLELEGFALSRLLMFEPDNTGLLTDFAYVKRDEGQYRDAAAILSRTERLMVTQNQPDSVLADIQIAMADAWFLDGNADSVLAVTERARLSVHSDEQRRLLDRYTELASWDAGRLDHRQAFDRSLDLRSSGDLNGAAEALQALADRVDAPEAVRDVNRELAYTLWDMGKLDEALPFLQRVYQYSADSTAIADYAGLLVQLGNNALVQDQDRFGAHIYLLQLTRLPMNRHSTWAHTQLAGLLRNHFESASLHAELALNSTSDSTLIQQLAVVLGDVKRRSGDFESAASFYTTAKRHERP